MIRVSASGLLPEAARQARKAMGVAPGPVPNVVRLLESHGVAAAGLDENVSHRVDAFSHQQAAHPYLQMQGQRPLVLLNPAK
jgi:hypothetical protein